MDERRNELIRLFYRILRRFIYSFLFGSVIFRHDVQLNFLLLNFCLLSEKDEKRKKWISGRGAGDEECKMLKYFHFPWTKLVWHLFQALVVICLCTNASCTCTFCCCWCCCCRYFGKLQSESEYYMYVNRYDVNASKCAFFFVFGVEMCWTFGTIMKTKSWNCMHIWCLSMSMHYASFQFHCVAIFGFALTIFFSLFVCCSAPFGLSFTNGTEGVLLHLLLL